MYKEGIQLSLFYDPSDQMKIVAALQISHHNRVAFSRLLKAHIWIMIFVYCAS